MRLRLNECLALRVKDVDPERNQVTVRLGKGGKDRLVPLPSVAKAPLAVHLAAVRRLHDRDRTQGFGRVVSGAPPTACRLAVLCSDARRSYAAGLAG